MVSAAWAFGFGLLAFEGLLDCSGNEDQPQGAGAVSGGGPNGGASSGGVSGTAAGGSPASSAAGSGGDLSELDAPDESQALLSFLEAKQYAGWAKEGESHPSEGPHGDGVRVYYSPKAAQALRSGAATFPAGAASVKELTRSGALYGYSVWVKVQDASDGGPVARRWGDDEVAVPVSLDGSGVGDLVRVHLRGHDSPRVFRGPLSACGFLRPVRGSHWVHCQWREAGRHRPSYPRWQDLLRLLSGLSARAARFRLKAEHWAVDDKEKGQTS